MTVMAEQLMRDFWSEWRSGTATALSFVFTRRSHTKHSPPPQSPRPAYLHVSPGVSDSARFVKDSVDDLVGDIEHWLTTYYSTAHETEQEDLVVLLPPKRQYVAYVEIIARQRPGLLIDPEDFPDSLVDTDAAE